MGRRGPHPGEIAQTGLIADVLEVASRNLHRTYTIAQMVSATGGKFGTVGVYLARLAHAKRIRKVSQGIYQGIEHTTKLTA